MQYGLIGERLGHSYSKKIHALIADYNYELCELAPDMLAGFMTAKSFNAINVTIPYKQAVMPFLDYIDPAAKDIGAVNTVVNNAGKLYGYNTDFYGMKAQIEYMGLDFKDKKVLILGTGGTSKTAYAVSKNLGASEIYRVSRSKNEGSISYEQAVKDHVDAHYIINTTPVGMYPKTSGVPIDIAPFTNLSGIFDAVYNPLRTDFILDGKEHKIPAMGGLYMLAAQAVYACEKFTGKTLSPALIGEVYNKIRQESENIVLTGMPSSGKTTVGRIIAQKTGRKFYDTDKLITEKAGKEITEIFAQYGEAGFRQIESDVIAEISAKSGCVIATGGGAVLNASNVRNLKKNGTLFFLDRSLENLIFTDDRPLSKSREDVEKLYAKRYDLYKATADCIIPADNSAEENADAIIKELMR